MSFKQQYIKKVIPAFKEKFGITNDLAVPKIEKVVVNVGVGRLVVAKNNDMLKTIENDLIKITGQKPASTAAKKSIASFKVRQGMQAGYKITLRQKRMYDFLEKLISISLPRARDFRGLDKKSIDGGGNLTIGIKEHIVFPEITSEAAKSIFGLQVVIATNAKDKEKGEELFRMLGFPLKKSKI